MKKGLILLFMFISVFCVSAKNDKDNVNLIPDYQIEGAGTVPGDETKVKVTLLVKNKKDATDEMFGKAAVHGLLFRGYTDDSVQISGMPSEHPAIAGSPRAYNTHIDYFEPFFVKDYSDYVRHVGLQKLAVKSGKVYRVTAEVRVATGQLKQDLQKDGIITGLNSGW